jgi:protein subunit release factor B
VRDGGAAAGRLLAECDVTAFQASGPGGQHRNRKLTAIRLRHRPSGIVVIGRRERSQHRNLLDALARLDERLAERSRARAPRVPTRPPRAAHRERVAAKRRRGETKRRRRRPGAGEDAG